MGKPHDYVHRWRLELRHRYSAVCLPRLVRIRAYHCHFESHLNQKIRQWSTVVHHEKNPAALLPTSNNEGNHRTSLQPVDITDANFNQLFCFGLRSLRKDAYFLGNRCFQCFMLDIRTSTSYSSGSLPMS